MIGSGISALQQNGFSTTRLDYDLGAGNDSFTGTGNLSDVVSGGVGDDVIDGGGGGDTLEGGAGADTLIGGAGDDDLLIRSGDQPELDTFIGGGGSDELFNLTGGDFTVSGFDYDDATETVNGSGVENIRLDGHTMLGTAAGDVFDLNGARFFEVNNTATGLELSTGGGNDVVIGSGTTAIQQNGFSTLRIDYDLGVGDDSFTGSGSIQDVVDGGAGDDTLDGGGGGDTLLGGTGVDLLLGNDGNDELDGGTDVDRVEGGGGDDRVILSAGSAHETEEYLGGPLATRWWYRWQS